MKERKEEIKENKHKSESEDEETPYTKYKKNIKIEYRPTTQMNYTKSGYNEKAIEQEVDAVLGRNYYNNNYY